MKRLVTVALAAASLLVASACNREVDASNRLSGTWKADTASAQIEEQPSTYVLKDGVYSCPTCKPPLEVAADGEFHPVPDRPYYDSMMVQVVDDRTVKYIRRKGDRTVEEGTMTLSPDGNTLTIAFVDSSVANVPATEGQVAETRVGPAPEGAHPISGSWETAGFSNFSDEALTFAFDVNGDTVNMSSPSGVSYSAQVGGPAVPLEGDPANTMVKIEMPDANTLRETYSRDGKETSVATYTVGEDGKLQGVSENKVQGSVLRYSADKQGG
ncbi:MAG: hypothetical protein ACR2JJ_09645 [Sphingomicrobium sp.]